MDYARQTTEPQLKVDGTIFTATLEHWGLILLSTSALLRAVHTGARRDKTKKLKTVNTNRHKRSMDDGQEALPEQQSSNPQQQNPLLMTPNMQASYFLGQCVMCPPGDPGPRGSPGPQGMPGRDGRDQILIGPVGEHMIQNYTRPGTQSPHYQGGASYIRWGKTSCPRTSELVYEGIMGSANDHNQKGSGVNYLCLPLQPTFADTPNSAGGGGYVYGVEYENNLLGAQHIAQSEAPCAVCLAPLKSTVLTMPGTNHCLGEQEWTLEYKGYMMSSHYTHFKSEFICVDEHAVGIPRTVHNNNENLLYLAEAKCSASGGGLPCPPYVDGHDILCAVCTL